MKPLQTLGTSRRFPKKRIGSNHDIVLHEHIFDQVTLIFIVLLLRGCSYGGELVWLSGLAPLGEMIFILHSHGIFYISSIKKFVMSLEKDYLIKCFLQYGDVKPLSRTNVLTLFN